jgi:hypothetical protein
MNKKLLVSAFLCFFVFSLGIAAKEEIKKGTPLRLVTYVYHHEWVAHYEPQNPYELEEGVEFDPFYTFDVPGNKDREALFFDLRAPIIIYWSDHDSRNVGAIIWFELISDIIPGDIEVWFGKHDGFGETNWARNSGLGHHVQTYKWIITRDSIESFLIIYKTGGRVPDEIAIPLLNDLIDHGFSCEISIEYRRLLGAESIRYNAVDLLATEASK